MYKTDFVNSVLRSNPLRSPSILSVQSVSSEVPTSWRLAETPWNIHVHSWLAVRKFSLKSVEEINYKLLDVQLNKAVIVNTQKPNARIESGFAPP
jgi:hypothetical protein